MVSLGTPSLETRGEGPDRGGPKDVWFTSTSISFSVSLLYFVHRSFCEEIYYSLVYVLPRDGSKDTACIKGRGLYKRFE